MPPVPAAPAPATRRDIEGAWQADGFMLLVDHVQGDPYASPSRFRVQVGGGHAWGGAGFRGFRGARAGSVRLQAGWV